MERIDPSRRKKWSITDQVINPTTVTSQLIISDLSVAQHNGTYFCDVHYYKTSFIRQSTTVIVESEYANHRYNVKLQGNSPKVN